jgi:hypothetical protein
VICARMDVIGSSDRTVTAEVRLERAVVEREFNEIFTMRSASLTPTQPALGRVWA